MAIVFRGKGARGRGGEGAKIGLGENGYTIDRGHYSRNSQAHYLYCNAM